MLTTSVQRAQPPSSLGFKLVQLTWPKVEAETFAQLTATFYRQHWKTDSPLYPRGKALGSSDDHILTIPSALQWGHRHCFFPGGIWNILSFKSCLMYSLKVLLKQIMHNFDKFISKCFYRSVFAAVVNIYSHVSKRLFQNIGRLRILYLASLLNSLSSSSNLSIVSLGFSS